MDKEELLNYVLDENNGLSKTREYKDYKIQVYYKPTDLLILQENGDNTQIAQKEYTRLQEKYSPYDYFILSLSKEKEEALYKSEGFGQFSELVQVLSFRMGQYTNLTTTSQDTIPVADYVFPRTYGMGGATNLMFVFSKEKSQDDDWVQFNLQEFGMGLGRQVFRFDRKGLDKAPKIKFEIIEKQQG